MSVRLRRAGAADARSAAEIGVETWRAAYRGIVPDAVLDGLSVAEREASMRERLAAPDAGFRMAIAEEGGRAVGFVAFGPTRDGDAAAPTGEIYAIYVRRDAWGRGVGGALLGHARDALRSLGLGRITLWTLAGLERTVRFYTRAGFAPDGAARDVAFDGAAVRHLRLVAAPAPDRVPL